MAGFTAELGRLGCVTSSPHYKTFDFFRTVIQSENTLNRTPLSLHNDMAKSARASSVKKNNQRLKKHVFGPIETARNERLSTKLLELASQPKPPKSEMEVEQNGM